MTELQHYIKHHFIIENKNLIILADLFKETELKKGDFFSIEGSLKTNLSFIKTGNLRIYSTIDCKEITQWISSPGEFVTELSSLIFNTSNRFSIQALTDCKLYTISRSDYDKIHQTIPEWHQIEKLFLAKCFTIVENRVFSFLSMSAEERYHQLFDMNKELFNKIPLQYIASMLGMSAETLSRIRNKSVS